GADTSLLTLGAANSVVTFADGASISGMSIVGSSAGYGQVVFSGSGSAEKIGVDGTSVKSVAYTGAEGVEFTQKGAVFAGSVSLGKGTFTLQDSVTAGSLSSAAGTKVVVDSGTLNGGAVTVGGTTTIEFTVTDKAIPGKFVATGTPTGEVSDIDIVIGSGFAEAGYVAKSIISFTGAGTNVSKLDISSKNKIVKWSLVKRDADSVDAVASYDTAAFKSSVLSAGAKGNALAFVDKLTNASSGPALKLLDLVSSNDTATATEALNRITTSSFGSHAAFASTDALSSSLNSRFNLQSAESISSGDESLDVGVWGQIFGSLGTQKADKSNPGYKVTTAGGTIGADTKISDSGLVGLAATYGVSGLKFKDFKTGDKTKSTNVVFSVYGKLDLPYNSFVRAVATFGSGKVKSNAKRLTAPGAYDVAKSSYNTMSYSLEALVGYKYPVLESTSLVPTAGLRYAEVNDGGYTETGSQYNLSATKKSSNKLTGIFGATVENKMDYSDYQVVSEAHVFGNYDFRAKTPTVNASIDGLEGSFDITPSKAPKFSTNLGLGVTLKTGMVEYTGSYDAKLAKKFNSHLGSLKVKVNL
ncbi:MAG: autotransporter domain-containing protein, partial [Rickettsiaceae bacterium]|nr:autotransporter domain-containing protein [Rickettsiaceae bacterium]